MNVYDLVRQLYDLSKERSRVYNNGEICHSFAGGWFMADMQANLDNMGLSKKQLKVLEERIAKMKKIVEEQ